MHYRFILLIVTLCWLPTIYSQDLVDADSQAEIQVTNAPEDQAIQTRLTNILDVIESYDDIEVNVKAGVVMLTGTVPTARAGRELVTLASRVEGVIYVQNQFIEQTDISTRVQPTTQKIQEMFASLMNNLPLLLLAIGTLILFWFIGRWAGNRGEWLHRLGLSELAADLGERIIRTVIIGIGILIALQIMDATALVGALLGVAGVFGLAVGFAFRNIVENYLAGVLLSARNPFKIGDFIQIGEFTGNVVRLTSRDTVLMTGHGNHLRIPNSTIITSVMTNFSRNPLRQFVFKTTLSATADFVLARQLGLTILQQMKGLMTEPGPQVLLEEIKDDRVELKFLAWINQHETDFAKARSEAIRLVKTGFDKAGIKLSESLHHVQLAGPAPTLISEEGESVAHRTPPAQSLTSVDSHAVDVATDPTIPKQLANELEKTDEENLLK